MSFLERRERTRVDSFWATIYMAGSIEHAKQVCRTFCMARGLCVTVEPTTFIYTGGEEVGFRIGLINYPRFPTTPTDIINLADELGSVLRVELAQHSYSVVTPTETIWRTWRKN
jgi:ferredoxin